MLSIDCYYVYMWLREDGIPYYVGKGYGKRGFTSSAHGVHCPPTPDRIIILHCSSEQEAFNQEIALIAHYGRKDLGTGCLRNLSDGGEGAAGVIVSEVTRKKQSDSMKGKQNSLGCKHSEETLKKRSKSLRQAWANDSERRTQELKKWNEHNPWTGEHHTEESRMKMKGSRTLTGAQVEYVRSRYAQGDTSQARLASELGVHQSTISLLLSGKFCYAWADGLSATLARPQAA